LALEKALWDCKQGCSLGKPRNQRSGPASHQRWDRKEKEGPIVFFQGTEVSSKSKINPVNTELCSALAAIGEPPE